MYDNKYCICVKVLYCHAAAEYFVKLLFFYYDVKLNSHHTPHP